MPATYLGWHPCTPQSLPGRITSDWLHRQAVCSDLVLCAQHTTVYHTTPVTPPLVLCAHHTILASCSSWSELVDVHAGQASSDSSAVLLQLPHMSTEVLRKLVRKRVRTLPDLLQLSTPDLEELLTSNGAHFPGHLEHSMVYRPLGRGAWAVPSFESCLQLLATTGLAAQAPDQASSESLGHARLYGVRCRKLLLRLVHSNGQEAPVRMRLSC